MWQVWGMLLNVLRGEDEGQSLVEYGLIIALIALVVVVALTAVSGGLSGLFNTIANKL